MENNNFNELNSNTQNALFDLIQNIQSKLNSETEDNKDKEFENFQNNNYEKNSNDNNFDFSSIISMFNNNSDQEKNTIDDNSNFNFDIGTILKLQKIFSNLNANDPKRNLLLSLKPFLRKSRQDKINEYITILTIGNALGIFNSRGDKRNE